MQGLRLIGVVVLIGLVINLGVFWVSKMTTSPPRGGFGLPQMSDPDEALGAVGGRNPRGRGTPSPGLGLMSITPSEYNRLKSIERQMLAARSQPNAPPVDVHVAQNAVGIGSSGWLPKMKVEPYSGSVSGPGPSKFIRDLERLKVGRGLTDREFMDRWVPTLLTEEAFDWFIDHPTWETFREFKTDLLERFQMPNSDNIIFEKILARVQGDKEPMADYADAMLKLFRQLANPWSEEQKIRFIYRNLSQPIKIILSVQSYDSVLEMVAHATSLEEAKRPVNRGRSENFRERDSFNQQESNANPGSTDRGGQGNRPRTSNSACYICGDLEHYARSCPRRFRDNQSGNDRGGPSGNQRGAPRNQQK